MKPEAIAQARERIARAKKAHGRLTSARNLDAIESAWADFLIAANSIYSKLEKGSKGGGPSEAWYGRMKHERKNDELLSYIHHARNADEHGIEPITKREPGSLRILGDIVLNGTFDPGGTMQVTGIPGGRPPGIEIRDPMVKLVPVFDDRFGDTFQVPTSHLGKPLSDPLPVDLSELALSYLQGLISAGAAFISPLKR